jgi:predicted nucleotidyltransferase
MDHVPNLDRLPEHRELLKCAIARFRADDRVVGLVLSGSLSRGGVADFSSDIDLYIAVRGDAFGSVLADRDVVAEGVGAPLFSFVLDPMPVGSQAHIVIYPGPVKIDFMYYRESDLVPDRKRAGRPVLKDSVGLMDAPASGTEGSALASPAAEVILELNQKFWTWCWYTFGKIIRGELWEALDGVHNIRSLALLPLLDWISDRPHGGYRRLEQKVDSETATRLQATTATLQPEALYAALQAEIALFCELRATIFDRYGLELDAAPKELIKNEINRRWSERKAQSR